jgi:hypothetical protein
VSVGGEDRLPAADRAQVARLEDDLLPVRLERQR